MTTPRFDLQPKLHKLLPTSLLLLLPSLAAAQEVPAESTATPGPNALFFIGLGGASCLGMLLTVYNLFVLIGVFRAKDEEAASGMAKAAWALSLAAWFLGPCGLFVAFIAWVIARLEGNKIWREESPISSATPVRMATVNAGALVLAQILMTVAVAFGYQF